MIALAIVPDRRKQVLIVCPRDDNPDRLWDFPSTPVADDEAPEAACRRMLHDDYGIDFDIQIGQPPLERTTSGTTWELRYFLGWMRSLRPRTPPAADVRWVPLAELTGYRFRPPSDEVARWLVETGL